MATNFTRSDAVSKNHGVLQLYHACPLQLILIKTECFEY